MTKDFLKFLNCLKRKLVNKDDNIVVSQFVLQTSILQQVDTFFDSDFPFPTQDSVKKKIMYQFFKYQNVHELLTYLKENGIETTILKGAALARNYPSPLSRISSDTDVLVNEDDIEKIEKLLKKRKFTIFSAPNESHHLVCHHPNTGMIEFHHRLYDEIFDELWFDNIPLIEENHIIFDFESLSFSTLGLTDGFIFTFLHFVKHYILDFVTVRWILDILFYIQTNSLDMDWERIWMLCENLEYSTLLSSLIGFGIEYLGFPRDMIPELSYKFENVEIFANDIEFLSCMDNRDKLNGFFHHLNIEAHKKDDYESFIVKYNKLGKLQTIFAKRDKLDGKFKILIKYPFLLPVIWVYRIIRALWRLICKQRKLDDFTEIIPEATKEIKNRIQVMKDLDVI